MISLAALGAMISFVSCLTLTPLVRYLCIRSGTVDQPGPLKIHTRPMPRLGGVAVVLSLCAGILISARSHTGTNAYLLIALGLVWLAGFADDLCNLSPYVRLTAQIVAGVLLWIGGWRLAPGYLPRAGILGPLVVCMLVMLLTNALNLWDGSDGLAAGVTAIVCAAYLAISHGPSNDPLTSAIAACLASSCVAFLFFNFPRNAIIFLGDSGSTVLGFCVALLALDRPYSVHYSVSVTLAPLMIAGLPLLDMVLAIFRRLGARTSPIQGDRLHLYDRMLIRGWSARRVAFVCYAITALLGIGAWLGVQLGTPGFLVVWFSSVTGLLVLAVCLGALKLEHKETREGQPLKLSSQDQVGPSL